MLALPIYIYAPSFYTKEVGLPLTQIGVVLLILRVIDTEQDPMIGVLSDRFARYRQRFLALGIGAPALGFWMLFHPSAMYTLLWFAASVLICTKGFSVVGMNFQILGSLWHAAEHDRTRITGCREGLGLIGLLIASILPSVLKSRHDAATSFHLLTLIYLPRFWFWELRCSLRG